MGTWLEGIVETKLEGVFVDDLYGKQSANAMNLGSRVN